MKIMIVRVPEASNEAAVLVALTELLAKKMIELDTDLPLGWPGQPLSADAYAGKLAQALAAPRLSVEEARQRLGL